MYTLNQTLDDQLDLYRLCADTPPRLPGNRELFIPNSFYGNDLAYKVYAGLPDNYNLKLVIPHGAETHLLEKIWSDEILNPLPCIAYYSEWSYDLYSKALSIVRSSKLIEHLASPYLYVREIIEKLGIRHGERRGTIFFPSHSCHHERDNSDFGLIAEQLAQTQSIYDIGPITVCIYWKDFLHGNHLPFKERGMQIVSAGHMFDPLFLFRLFHLCSIHKYSCSNSLGSSAPYSIAAGCCHFGLPNWDFMAQSISGDDPASYVRIHEMGTRGAETRSLWDCCFKLPDAASLDEQRLLAGNCLGEKHIMSPRALREKLLFFEDCFRELYGHSTESQSDYQLANHSQLYSDVQAFPLDYSNYLKLGFTLDALGLHHSAKRSWEVTRHSLYRASLSESSCTTPATQLVLASEQPIACRATGTQHDLHDYISPNFKVVAADSHFPNMTLGDRVPIAWPYLRKQVPHNWYVDRRSPTVGFLSRDEAHLLYNLALAFQGKPALEIGCWMGWSACHLALAGVQLDVVDPLLNDPGVHQTVSDSLTSAGVRDRVNLVPGYSPHAVQALAAQRQQPWSLIFIDGNHERPGPLEDAMVCAQLAASDAVIVFHDLASPDVAEGLEYLRQQGWNTMVYQTMQIMGVAWRGQVQPVRHLPDASVRWELPAHLQSFMVSGVSDGTISSPCKGA